MLSLLISTLLATTPAVSAVRTYAPVGAGRGALTFRVSGLRPAQIERVRILHHGQLRPVDLAAVRAEVAAGRPVRAPLVATTPHPGDARLVVYTTDAPPAA